jgi:uncharacterized protein (DUF1684 family)
MQRRTFILGSLTASVAAAGGITPAQAADGAYVAQVEAWRRKHETDYTKEYVPLAGLYFLKAGPNLAGSASNSDVVLPARLPAHIGRFVNENRRVRFEPVAGAPVTLKGLIVDSPKEIRSDGAAPGPDELAVGDVAFWVHESGERLGIRVRDPQGEPARTFAGFRWFPVAERHRVTGRFIADAAPREMKVPNLLGDVDSYTTEGVVEFTLDGQTVRLRPYTTRPGRLYFVFRDATSGHETYAAARFLYADLKPDGTTVLDFNQAYNPPCSFNAFTTCPVPLPENRLKIRVLAGERAYPHHPVSRP